jgi:hypothetical protein
MTVENEKAKIFAGNNAVLQVLVSSDIAVSLDMEATYKIANVLRKSIDNGISLSLVDDSLLITIELTRDDTIDVTPGKYYHEIEVKDVNGDPYTVMTGHMEIAKTIIRDEES